MGRIKIVLKSSQRMADRQSQSVYHICAICLLNSTNRQFLMRVGRMKRLIMHFEAGNDGPWPDSYEVGPHIFQPTLADQIRSVASRLTGLNEFDRDRLEDIAGAMRRKEAELEEFRMNAARCARAA